MFHVRVDFTPATGEDDVTVSDHMFLSVMDSSDPAKEVDVSVAVGPDDDPIDAPLITANIYDGTLEYDTRHNYEYPLEVTIDQDVVETHNPMESADVGEAEEEEMETVVKAQATFSGPLSLTGQSIITVTFDKAVTGLTTADFTVTGGEPSFIRVKPNLAAAMANKVWEVAIDADDDPFTESITVTIAADLRHLRS